MASKFIARVPCRFGGKSYKIGDEIPAVVVLEKRVRSLTSMGVIEEAPPEPPKKETKAKKEAPPATKASEGTKKPTKAKE